MLPIASMLPVLASMLPFMAAPTGHVPFEFCISCFSMRHVATGKWLGSSSSMLARLPINATLTNEPHFMWRWRGGTYNSRGLLTESFVCAFSSTHSGAYELDCLRNPPGPALAPTWDVMPNHENHTDYLWRARTTVPGSTRIQLYSCGKDAGVGARNGTSCVLPLTLSLAHGDQLVSHTGEGDWFDVVCDTSCGQGLMGTALTSSGVFVLATILVLVALPTIAILCLRQSWCQSFGCSRGERLPSQWPTRKRPWAVFFVFQFSWMLLIAGQTPVILLHVLQQWPNQAYRYSPLSVMGYTGMLLSLRPDDPPSLLRLVGASMLVGVALYICMLLRETPDGQCEGYRPLSYCPWSGAYQLIVLDLPRIGACVAVMIAFVLMLRPLRHVFFPCRMHGTHTGPSAFASLWKALRTTLAVVGCASLVQTCAASLAAIGLQPIVPVEVQQMHIILSNQCLGGVACLISFAVSSPWLRLMLHWRGYARPSGYELVNMRQSLRQSPLPAEAMSSPACSTHRDHWLRIMPAGARARSA